MAIDNWEEAAGIITEVLKLEHYEDRLEENLAAFNPSNRSSPDNYLVALKGGQLVLKVSEFKSIEDAFSHISLAGRLKRMRNQGHEAELKSLIGIHDFFPKIKEEFPEEGHSKDADPDGNEISCYYVVTEIERSKTDLETVLKSILKGKKKKYTQDFIEIRQNYLQNKESFAVTVGKKVAGVLNVAYSNEGMIHRDLKPSNILIDGINSDKTPDVWVSDFQTVYWANRKDDTGQTVNTAKGETVGTIAYVSPEDIVAAHNIKLSDDELKTPCNRTPSRDIYSLGLVIYQTLSGKKQKDLTKLSYYFPEGADTPEESFEQTKLSSQEEFQKYLGLIDEEGQDSQDVVKDFVFRYIIKKCLAFKNGNVQKQWEKDFEKANAEFLESGTTSIRTPWEDRYQSHEELIKDLEIADKFSEFRIIEEDFAKNIKNIDFITDRKKSIQRWMDIFTNLKNKPYLCDKVEKDGETVFESVEFKNRRGRSELLDAFEDSVIVPVINGDMQIIELFYNKAEQEFGKAQKQSERISKSTRLNEYASLLEKYNKLGAVETGRIGIKECSVTPGKIVELANDYDPCEYNKTLENAPLNNKDDIIALELKLDEFEKAIVGESEGGSCENVIAGRRAEIQKRQDSVLKACETARRTYTGKTDHHVYDSEAQQEAEKVVNACPYQGFYELAAVMAEITCADIVTQTARGVSIDRSELESKAKSYIDKLEGRKSQFPEAFAWYDLSQQTEFNDLGATLKEKIEEYKIGEQDVSSE